MKEHRLVLYFLSYPIFDLYRHEETYVAEYVCPSSLYSYLIFLFLHWKWSIDDDARNNSKSL